MFLDLFSSPYGSRPHRPDRGTPSLMNAIVRRNLNIGDRAPAHKGSVSKKTWFKITVSHSTREQAFGRSEGPWCNGGDPLCSGNSSSFDWATSGFFRNIFLPSPALFSSLWVLIVLTGLQFPLLWISVGTEESRLGLASSGTRLETRRQRVPVPPQARKPAGWLWAIFLPLSPTHLVGFTVVGEMRGGALGIRCVFTSLYKNKGVIKKKSNKYILEELRFKMFARNPSNKKKWNGGAAERKWCGILLID